MLSSCLSVDDGLQVACELPDFVPVSWSSFLLESLSASMHRIL